MKYTTLCLAMVMAFACYSQGENEAKEFRNSKDLIIENASIKLDKELDHLVFSIYVKGLAGQVTPSAFGFMDGAPVLGYVFPTTLKSTDVGFGTVEGIVALALTSHPDFDDTPLWDENNDRVFDNDGIIWHPHWVILVADDRVAGGLSVRQIREEKATLPPTNPGMPMYMDSPGFNVITKGNRISTVIPISRINNQVDFQFDAVTAYMQVNTSKDSLPMLGVYNVYSILSKDLTLPFKID